MRYKSWDKNWNHVGFQEKPAYNGQLPFNYGKAALVFDIFDIQPTYEMTLDFIEKNDVFLDTVDEISSIVVQAFPKGDVERLTLRSKFREICLERGLDMSSYADA